MRRIRSHIIRVIGPGGAGKTTVGQALAARLGIGFVDLEEQFAVRARDISQFLSAHSYDVYAGRNVETYLEMLNSLQEAAVMALSSGFITYPDDVHRDYERLRRDILASPNDAGATAVIRPRDLHC
jgi:shikimate kinase